MGSEEPLVPGSCNNLFSQNSKVSERLSCGAASGSFPASGGDENFQRSRAEAVKERIRSSHAFRLRGRTTGVTTLGSAQSPLRWFAIRGDYLWGVDPRPRTTPSTSPNTWKRWSCLQPGMWRRQLPTDNPPGSGDRLETAHGYSTCRTVQVHRDSDEQCGARRSSRAWAPEALNSFGNSPVALLTPERLPPMVPADPEAKARLFQC